MLWGCGSYRIPFLKGDFKMTICKYDMVLDNISKHSKLIVKEEYFYNVEQYNNPEQVLKMMCEVFHLDEAADEYVYLISLNTKSRILAVFEVSHGVGNASMVDARGVFMRALLSGAQHVILIHNHPSGDVTPSRQDMMLSKRIKEAGELLSVNLLDHIIIGDKSYYSFKEKGTL